MTVITRSQSNGLNNTQINENHVNRGHSRSTNLPKSTLGSGNHENSGTSVASKESQLDGFMSSHATKTTVSHEKPSTQFSFGGPLGTFSMIFSLPLIVIFLNELCSINNCQFRWISLPHDLHYYWNKDCMQIVLAWIAFQALLYMSPLGTKVHGFPLRNGHRLTYRCNGFHALIISTGLLLLLKFYFKVRMEFVLHHWTALMTSAMLCALVLSIFLYIKAYWAKNDNLSDEGNTGYWSFDFFMGRELNPRIGSFDLKFFCEFRPGLIAWVMLNFVFCMEKYETNGGESNYALYIVTFFQFCYVADALWYEECILSTIDIVQEGFGFMLAFGDLAFVPFMYTLTTRFLFLNPSVQPSYLLIFACILNFVGFYIFRQANAEKHTFRSCPNNLLFAQMKTIATKTGKHILCDGWWGFVRHPNYLGDIVMAVAWSLPCGFQMAMPWYYPLHLTSLLSHRALRDGDFNRRKYGAAWRQYCQMVPYRIFPKVF